MPTNIEFSTPQEIEKLPCICAGMNGGCQSTSRGATFTFKPEGGPAWVGCFGVVSVHYPTAALQLGKGVAFVIIAGGAAYFVDTLSRRIEEIFGAAFNAWTLEEVGCVVLSDATCLVLIGESGVQWVSRRFATDGIAGIYLADGWIHGDACNCQGGWVRFRVCARSGEVVGGESW